MFSFLWKLWLFQGTECFFTITRNVLWHAYWGVSQHFMLLVRFDRSIDSYSIILFKLTNLYCSSICTFFFHFSLLISIYMLLYTYRLLDCAMSYLAFCNIWLLSFWSVILVIVMCFYILFVMFVLWRHDCTSSAVYNLRWGIKYIHVFWTDTSLVMG